MEKLSVKKIIDFKNKSDRSKKSFASSLSHEIIDNNNIMSSGGDYWIMSLSAMSNTFKYNDTKFIHEKIELLNEKIDQTTNNKTKNMYQRNLDILLQYINLDIKKWKPEEELTLHKQTQFNSIIQIHNIEIKVKPHHVFSFEKNDKTEVGAIWFIARLEKLTDAELGIFADTLFEFLIMNFSEEYEINPKYCIAVDIVYNKDVNFSQITENKIPRLLSNTIQEIKNLI